jgi:hypothetical protein
MDATVVALVLHFNGGCIYTMKKTARCKAINSAPAYTYHKRECYSNAF